MIKQFQCSTKDLNQDGHATYIALDNQNHFELKTSLNVTEIYSHRRKLLKGFEGVGNSASERGEGRGGFRKSRGGIGGGEERGRA